MTSPTTRAVSAVPLVRPRLVAMSRPVVRARRTHLHDGAGPADPTERPGRVGGQVQTGAMTERALPEVTLLSEPYWTGGAVGELRICSCRRLRRADPPAGAVVPVVRLARDRHHRRERSGHRRRRHRRRPPVGPCLPAPLRGGQRGPRRGPTRAHHLQHRRRRARGRRRRPAGRGPLRARRRRAGCPSSPRSTSPSPPSCRRRTSRPGSTGVMSGPWPRPASSRTTSSSPASACPRSADASCGRRWP